MYFGSNCVFYRSFSSYSEGWYYAEYGLITLFQVVTDVLGADRTRLEDN